MMSLLIALQVASGVAAIASMYGTLLSLSLIRTNNQLLETINSDLDFGLVLPSGEVQEKP